VVSGAGVDNRVFDIVLGNTGVAENLGDFFLGFPRAVWVVQIALRHVDGTGDVAGFQVEVFAAAGKAVGLAGIDKQAGVVFHVIDRGNHARLWFYNLVGFDSDIARASHRRQL